MGDDDIEIGAVEARAVAAFHRMVFNEFIEFDEARAVLYLTASSPEMVGTWLERISDAEAVSERRGEDIPTPNPGTFRRLQFWDFRRLRHQFVDAMLTEFNARVNSISDIGRMAVYNIDENLYFPFYDFNPQSLIFPFRERREGILATVSGVMGAGKTDFALRISEELLSCPKPIFNVITNIWLDDKTLSQYDGRLFYERTMRELLRRLCNTVIDGGRHSVVVLDETSMFFSRREPGKKTNILLEKFIRLIRKYGASLMFIDQQREGLPGAALELRTVMYHKNDLTKVYYSSALAGRSYNQYLDHVPKTSLKYDTKRVGYFSQNVPLQALFDFIEKKEDEGVDPIGATLQFLECTPDPGDLSKDERIIEFVRDNPGSNQTQIIKGVGLTNQGYASVMLTRLVGEGRLGVERDGNSMRYYTH